MNADDVAEIVEVLSRRFEVESVAEVCNATKERQDAVKSFDGDALLVLGSVSSSNTRRLCEVAGCEAYRAGSVDEVSAIDFSAVERLGVTSGASTPESFFGEAVKILSEKYIKNVQELK
jgi:4-hydroxy-3-methylbut-2-enyl diphosphate reductase